MNKEQTDIYLLNEHITALYKEIKELKVKLQAVKDSLMSESYIKENYDEGTLDNEFIRGIRYQRERTKKAK